MQHRTDDAPTFPGAYVFFGGGLFKGEDPLVGVKREVLEEIEYILKEPKKILSLEYDNEYNFGKKYYFLEQYDATQRIHQKEGQGYAWVDPELLHDFDIPSHNIEVIKNVKHLF